MAGYMTHLILDETWITRMYRPLFGKDGVFETEATGAVMDRVMQMELDTLALERLDVLKTQLASFDGGVELPFIDGDTLAEWHEWVTSFVSREFTWERLRFMASRITRGDESHPAHAIADGFLRGMPDTLDVLHETVSDGETDGVQTRRHSRHGPSRRGASGMRIVYGLKESSEALLTGRGMGLDSAPASILESTEAAFGKAMTPIETAQYIIARVREGGDDAVRDMTKRLDGIELGDLQVPASAIEKAYDAVDADVVDALRLAAGRVRRFQEMSRPQSWVDFGEGYGELVNPVERVGVYVPGGTARFPLHGADVRHSRQGCGRGRDHRSDESGRGTGESIPLCWWPPT